MKEYIKERVIFIYNANSGVRNKVLDSMQKVFRPSTYDCNLCDITFGVLTENRTWKKFRQQSSYQMLFLHKDEFTKKYASKFGYKFDFPIVLMEGANGLEVLISTNELHQFKTSHDLIKVLNDRI